jgi:1,4-alpha-glucan branching enzyme
MFGSYDEKFSSLRALYGFMFAHPGKKLNFMGGEFGQFIEWNPKRPLDWFLHDYPRHAQMQRYVKDLGAFYTSHPALYQVEDGWAGFTWLNVNDAERSSLCFMRTGSGPEPQRVVCAFNFTPVPLENWIVGLPADGTLTKVLCSDAEEYGGTGLQTETNISAREGGFGGLPYRAELCIPPLSAVYYVFTENQKGVANHDQ